LYLRPTYDKDDEELRIVDWEKVARILSQVRQRIRLDVTDVSAWMQKILDCSLGRFTDTPPLHVLRMIAAACSPTNPWILCIRHWQHCLLWMRSNFLTVYYMHGLRMTNFDQSREPSLRELLRVPSLRSVCFYHTRSLPSSSERINERHGNHQSLVFC
jgi:hypothetical protein